MSDRAWRKTREWEFLVAWVYREESVCWLCLDPVDFGQPPRSKWAPSVDHVKPVSTHPHLALERTNCRLAHYGCNSRRSARGDGMTGYTPSREW